MNGMHPYYIFYTFYTATFLFYIADVLQKMSSTGRSTWTYIFYRSLFTCSISLIASFLIIGLDGFPGLIASLEIISISWLCSLGFFFYIKAVNTTRFSNVGSLSIIGNVFQMLIGFVFLKESFQWNLIPVILLMSTGSLLQLFFIQSSKGALDVILSVFFWTVGYSALSRVLQHVNVWWTIPLMEFSILIMSATMIGINKEKESIASYFTLKSWYRFILIGIFITAGSYFNNLSFQRIPVSVISILQLSIMPITYLLSLKIFKEKPSRIEWISFLTGMTGFGLYVWMKWYH